jgi:arylsulfatase A-like enzyme
LRTEYDEYLAFADAEFGRLYDAWDAAGILENTYVVVTSDHGQLFERGVHGHITELLHEPVIHIPLLVSRPGQKQREDIIVPTSSVDVLPSLLHFAGRAIPDWCEGRTLPDGQGGTSSHERSIFAIEAKRNAAQGLLSKGTVSLRRGQHKLIHYFGYDGLPETYELYDLENDPEELENLHNADGDIDRDLRKEIADKLVSVNQLYSAQPGGTVAPRETQLGAVCRTLRSSGEHA